MSTAIVTGASGGIGLELARLLAADGHHVVLAARSADRLASLVAREVPGARAVSCDLADPAGPGKLVAEVPAADILVNNAGVGDFGPFAEADLDKTMAMIRLNVATLTELTHHYLPGMLERGSGRILNVASTAAFQPGPLMAVYYATNNADVYDRRDCPLRHQRRRRSRRRGRAGRSGVHPGACRRG